MAARYFTLVADERWLAGVTPLDATFQAEAESYADDAIDTELHDWDRSLWGAASAPSEILRAAELIASGRYRQLEYSAIRRTRREGDEDPGQPLIAEGMELLERIQARGWVLDANGQKATPIDESPSAGGMYLEIRR